MKFQNEWIWENFWEDNCTPALFVYRGLQGTIWLLFGKAPLRPFTLKCIISLLDERFSLNGGAMNFLTVSHSRIKNIFGVQVHFKSLVYSHLVYTHLVYYPFGLPQYAKNSHFPCPELNPIHKLKP